MLCAGNKIISHVLLKVKVIKLLFFKKYSLVGVLIWSNPNNTGQGDREPSSGGSGSVRKAGRITFPISSGQTDPSPVVGVYGAGGQTHEKQRLALKRYTQSLDSIPFRRLHVLLFLFYAPQILGRVGKCEKIKAEEAEHLAARW